MKRSLELGEFAFEALGGEEELSPGRLGERVRGVIRFYLRDRDGGGTGWAYPDFLREREPSSVRPVEIDVDEALWSELAAEAERQGVSPESLVEHASLYFAAELNAGRITTRILGGLEQPRAEPGGA